MHARYGRWSTPSAPTIRIWRPPALSITRSSAAISAATARARETGFATMERCTDAGVSASPNTRRRRWGASRTATSTSSARRRSASRASPGCACCTSWMVRYLCGRSIRYPAKDRCWSRSTPRSPRSKPKGRAGAARSGLMRNWTRRSMRSDRRVPDHSSDALLAAAWLRKVGEDSERWSPRGMTKQIARTEGWTFGAR